MRNDSHCDDHNTRVIVVQQQNPNQPVVGQPVYQNYQTGVPMQGQPQQQTYVAQPMPNNRQQFEQQAMYQQ